MLSRGAMARTKIERVIGIDAIGDDGKTTGMR